MTMKIHNYKEINKGALISSFTIQVLKWGVEIRECTEWNKNGKRWIGFPNRQYEKDGVKKYFSFIGFPEKEMQGAFELKALAALDLAKQEMRQTQSNQSNGAKANGYGGQNMNHSSTQMQGSATQMSFNTQVQDEELPF